MVGRNTGKSIMVPLRPKSCKNAGPPPPESKKEVTSALRRHVKSVNCVGGTDSGHGLVAAFKSAGTPVATARHQLDELEAPFVTHGQIAPAGLAQGGAKLLRACHILTERQLHGTVGCRANARQIANSDKEPTAKLVTPAHTSPERRVRRGQVAQLQLVS